MKKLPAAAVLVLAAVIAVTSAGCEPKSDVDSEMTVSENKAEKRTADELRAEIIGQWGRLDEVMHYFNPDMSCVIGGMQGTYDIDENDNLIMTTMSGSETVYEWAAMRTQAESENYWFLDGNILKVNGNEFVKIESENTPDLPFSE